MIEGLLFPWAIVLCFFWENLSYEKTCIKFMIGYLRGGEICLCKLDKQSPGKWSRLSARYPNEPKYRWPVQCCGRWDCAMVSHDGFWLKKLKISKITFWKCSLGNFHPTLCWFCDWCVCITFCTYKKRLSLSGFHCHCVIPQLWCQLIFSSSAFVWAWDWVCWGGRRCSVGAGVVLVQAQLGAGYLEERHMW